MNKWGKNTIKIKMDFDVVTIIMCICLDDSYSCSLHWPWSASHKQVITIISMTIINSLMVFIGTNLNKLVPWVEADRWPACERWLLRWAIILIRITKIWKTSPLDYWMPKRFLARWYTTASTHPERIDRMHDPNCRKNSNRKQNKIIKTG